MRAFALFLIPMLVCGATTPSVGDDGDSKIIHKPAFDLGRIRQLMDQMERQKAQNESPVPPVSKPALPFYAGSGEGWQSWYFLISKDTKIESESTAKVTGIVRHVKRDLKAKTEETTDIPYDAFCKGKFVGIGKIEVKPWRPARGGEEMAYAAWREACADFIPADWSPATVVCTEKVPKLLLLMAAYGQSHKDVADKVVDGMDYYLKKYCRIAHEPLRAIGSEKLANGCTMKHGLLRGYGVYWVEDCNNPTSYCISYRGQQLCNGM